MGRREQRQNLKMLRQGRRKAYEAAVLQHYRAVYRFMAYLTRDTVLAEELTQETFASAWANIDSFKARSSFETWLHRIAYRKFIDSKRSRRRDAALMAGLEVQNDNAAKDVNPLHRLAADENTRLLYEAMRSLKQPEYIAILLHYIQGLSFRQVAKVLNQPVGTVKWQTSRALKTLKQYLSGRV
ncbi:MAG: RNA polymerase sigma factor [Phycisphaerae bacterium]|nr:RNA polymerase sigma factor [Phycisphaerae bacterium]